MARSAHLKQVAHLSVVEKLDLVEDLWDSIAEEADNLPLQEWQAKLLDQRLAEVEATPGVGEDWATVKARILSEG